MISREDAMERKKKRRKVSDELVGES